MTSQRTLQTNDDVDRLASSLKSLITEYGEIVVIWGTPEVMNAHRSRTPKMSLIEWLGTINDEKMHHIGEFFSYLTHKAFITRNGIFTKPFNRWLSELKLTDSELKALNESFNVYRDMIHSSFLLQRKPIKKETPEEIEAIRRKANAGDPIACLYLGQLGRDQGEKNG